MIYGKGFNSFKRSLIPFIVYDILTTVLKAKTVDSTHKHRKPAKMVSVISKVIGLALVLLLGCVVWLPSAVAQDEPIETLEGMEVSGTFSVQEERKFSIPKPDTTAIMPLSGLIAADIPKTHTVSQDGPKIVRDSIADRKGMWKFVRASIREEWPIGIVEPDTTTIVPLNGLVVAAIPKTPTVSRETSKMVRDSIADRKGLRKPVRLIKSERPPYPQVARKQGWEGVVVLRIIVGTGGDVENVTTQTSSGHPALDESAAQSVKTWRFSPAKDGEFPIATKVDLPVRFSLDEYGIQFSQPEPEPEPEPEPVREKKPARLIKSDRPLYPQVARKEGWEGTVVLRITIGTGGDVENVTTQTSSGYPALDESAAQSVKTWQFDPAKDGDVPIATSVDLPVRFDLEEYDKQEKTRTAE